PSKAIIPDDLSKWYYRAPRNFVAVDPERGRIVFPPGQLPKQGVHVSYHYAFSAAVGGGEYDRVLSQPTNAVISRVTGKDELEKALRPWQNYGGNDQPEHAVIEILNSGVYTLPINLTLQQRHSLQIRAANWARPVIRLLDYMADRPDAFSIK